MSLTENSLDTNTLTLAQRRAIAEEFLRELSMGIEGEQRVVVSQKEEVDSGFPVKPFNNSLTLAEGKNIYACIAAVNPSTFEDSGKKVWRRRKEDVAAGLALMIDDIGSGRGSKGSKTVEQLASVLPPTVVVETSPKNFQAWYFFDVPERDVSRFKNFICSFVADVLIDGGDKLDDPVRIARVPFGVNTKRTPDGVLKYTGADGKPWIVRLHSADYDRRYSIDQIAAAFKVEIRYSPKYEKRETLHERNAFDDAVLNAVVEAYREAGALAEDRSVTGKYRIRCPWGAEHTSGNGLDAFIAGPEAGMDHPYLFSCSHTTCKDAKRGWTAFIRECGASDKVEQLVAEELARVNALFASTDEWEQLFANSKQVEAAEMDTRGYNAETKKSAAAAAAAQSAGKTKWSEGWYYLASKDRVMRSGELTTYSKQGFDALFAREGGVEGGRAFDYVRKNVGFSHADGTAYLAGAEPVFTFKGQTLVNEFISSSIPKAAAWYTDEGLAAVETIRYHLTLLTGEYDKPRTDQTYAQMLESWIALNVQFPGEIIGIAPLIKGIQGDGKTVIFNKLMGALLGMANVKEASTKEVCSDFNPYAYGAAVRVIEELKMAGENRFAVADGVKPLITNRVVRVVAKRANGIDLPNATNYVALTNHPDAVPIDDGDRRWFIIFTPWDSISDLEAVIGDIRVYFRLLHKAIEEEPAALRKYFEECAIHADFFHGMRAPITPWRGAVIDQEQALIGGEFFDAYVEHGEPGVSRDIVATRMLTKAFERDMPRGTEPKTRQLSRLLKAKKWHRVPGVVKLGSGAGTHIVYVSDIRILDMGLEMRNEKLRALFLATMPADYEKNAKDHGEANGGF